MIKSPVANDNSRLVYSTDQPVQQRGKVSAKRKKDSPAAAQERVIVRKERKGRGGKCVTVVEGLPMNPENLESLLKKFKEMLGTGGTIKGNSLIIQGDRSAPIINELRKMGCNPRRSGG